ncbi:MAG: RNA polymerase sigma factor [Deltaproteobacteria bacterium]|nr:RNA polymerase sigma factor [Deltaproteobacteria bacterium]
MPEVVPQGDLDERDLVVAPVAAPVVASGAVTARVEATAALEEADKPAADDPDALEAYRERMLLRRLRRGDERAFAELVKANQDRVFDLVFRMLGDREEALDLSQEIFVSVHSSVGRFRGESRLSTWIFRVAKNHCLNRLKYLSRRERGRSTEISDVPESVLEANAPSQRPDDAVSVGETRAMVQQAITELDEEHRLLVVLRDVEGLSYHEIASITEQPEGTVKSRLHRARAALAEIMARLEGV